MRNSIRRAALGGIATLGVAALFAGCAPAPESDGSSDTAAAVSDFLPCMASDNGGFNDKSFNQLGYEGLTDAADALDVEPITVESASETDFTPNIDSLIDQGCTLIVTVGFLLSEATIAAAEANPELEFAIIDDQLDANQDGAPDVDNGKPIIFDTAQAAFLAGYTAAAYTKTGTVGTYGGMQIPTVTIFMDGFADGVSYYNEQNSTTVTVAGWDVTSQTGSFTGGFEAGVEAKSAAQTLIDQNVDVLMPVGGPIYQSAIQAIRDSGKSVALIGVDADLTETDPENSDLFLTSVLKGIKVGVSDVVTAAGGGEFDNTPFIGTLENDGVGIAPFHDFESQIPADLQSQLDEVTAGIIEGSIPVESPSSPKQ